MLNKNAQPCDPGIEVIAENRKIPVTLSDFNGNWTVWSVMPFDSATPVHALPVQFGDTIQIATSEAGYRPAGDLNACEAAAAAINLTRVNSRRSPPGSDISVLQYLSASAELSGTLVHDFDNEENEFVFNIKHIGEITREMIDEMRQHYAGDKEKSAKFEHQAKALESMSLTAGFSRRPAGELNGLRVRDLLFTWTNRFKHPGGYAHVHESA